ncbi:MAG TPA: SDR family NAD(P)-dependent oxidoreductase [Bacteroidales bacterium]|nr:SDR family NAD(P)-dependent oxidoreductase [Bacteroidales bacterium]HPI87196.1 SDR family NAD(P)-dependent oxidoreductase [Bacteroidales bacterium]
MLDSDCDWILITGATTDMGYEMARMLAAKGENLVLVCKDENRLCHMARELNEVSDIIIMPVDLSKKNSLYLIADECERLGLRIGALFNFA